MRIRKRQQRGAPASAAAPNTSSSDANLPVSLPAGGGGGRVEESIATIEPLNVNPGVQEQTAVVRELAEQVEIQAVHESSSGTLVAEELSQSSTRPGSFTWLDKLWHTKGFQPAEPHVGLEEYLSSWNVGQKSISFAGESSAIAPASSTFPLPDVSPKAAGEQQGLLKLQREEFFHAGEEMSAGEKLEPAIASNQSIMNTAISVSSGSLAPVPHAGSHAIQRYNSCASGTDSTPTIIATSEHRQSSTVPRAMISLTGSSGSDVNLGGEPSVARDSDVVDHLLRSDASIPKPVSDVQRSVVLVQEADHDIDIEARTQAASIQVAIDSQLAMDRKADRPRQLEDDVALADPAGSEEARSGRGLIGQIVERSSKSSDDPGCRGIAHQQVEEGGVETLQACVTSRYEPTKMTAIKTWQTDITAAAASSSTGYMILCGHWGVRHDIMPALVERLSSCLICAQEKAGLGNIMHALKIWCRSGHRSGGLGSARAINDCWTHRAITKFHEKKILLTRLFQHPWLLQLPLFSALRITMIQPIFNLQKI
ncbi:unnamed protein product [Sphagnum troendelagicum]